MSRVTAKHPAITGADVASLDGGDIPATRTISAGTGLTGGGDLSANRSFAVAFGTSSSTATVGDDARLSDARPTTDLSVAALVVAGTTKTALDGEYIAKALLSEDTDLMNFAIGAGSLASNTTGSGVVGFGTNTLAANTEGNSLSAFGFSTMYMNTTGSNNAAFGNGSMLMNTTGSNNSALGINALTHNSTGSENCALGTGALTAGTTGIGNCALGFDALHGPNADTANTSVTGSNNTAVGCETGSSDATDPSDLTAVGHRAIAGSQALALGSGATASHTGSVALGYGSTTTAAAQVMVGTRDIEITGSATKGIVLASPNGTRYRLTVSDVGAAVFAAA